MQDAGLAIPGLVAQIVSARRAENRDEHALEPTPQANLIEQRVGVRRHDAIMRVAVAAMVVPVLRGPLNHMIALKQPDESRGSYGRRMRESVDLLGAGADDHK